MLTHLSLFSGIGGIDLAAEWAGFQTVAFCEKNKFCQQILNKHWSNVPIIEDIHDVPTSELLGQHRTGGLTLISGGFPCQPFSTSGNRLGAEDDRYLWPKMLEVIRCFNPRWVVGENVAGLTYDMAFDTVLSDLEKAGYYITAYLIPACSVNAWHRRERVFIVANATSSILSPKQERQRETMGAGQDFVAYGEKRDMAGLTPRDGSTWDVEPRMDRVVHGVPARLDERLTALGNAVVPAQIYPILKGIADIERGMQDAKQ